MLPKVHLTLHYRMSGSRWVFTPFWLSESWISFLYSSSVYCFHLFLISSAFVRSIPFLSFTVPIFAWNVPVDCSHEIKRCLLLGRKVMTNLDSILKSRDIPLPTKVHLIKAMFFSSSHVWMWELNYKESWAQKNWSFWTVVLEKTLESFLDCKKIQPVHPKVD